MINPDVVLNVKSLFGLATCENVAVVKSIVLNTFEVNANVPAVEGTLISIADGADIAMFGAFIFLFQFNTPAVSIYPAVVIEDITVPAAIPLL